MTFTAELFGRRFNRRVSASEEKQKAIEVKRQQIIAPLKLIQAELRKCGEATQSELSAATNKIESMNLDQLKELWIKLKAVVNGK